MVNVDPPDLATGRDCQWCGNDPRATAFCSKRCEDESRAANQEWPDEEPLPNEHDRDLARIGWVFT